MNAHQAWQPNNKKHLLECDDWNIAKKYTSDNLKFQ